MSAIELVNINNQLLRSVQLRVNHGECFVIVGPSGAGKTTLLRVIAGLQPHTGSVFLDGEHMNGVPPHLRRIGYVSQDLHLFPHLSLEGNLLLGMERLTLTRREKRARAQELMMLLKIHGLAPRNPATLSGGEKQRAALARALASSPRILLLDEPFSKLDFRTSLYLRGEFKKLQQKLKLTTILVTHDMTEARDMGNGLAVMQSGHLEHAAAHDNHAEGGTCRADLFLERENVLACTRPRYTDYGVVEVEWAGERLCVPDEGEDFSQVTIPAGKIVIDLDRAGRSLINRFQGVISEVRQVDETVLAEIGVGGECIRGEWARAQWEELGLAEGDRVHIRLRLQDLRIGRGNNGTAVSA